MTTNKSTKREIILLGYSSIKEGFAEADYGVFSSVGDAELVGRASFKATDWVVAHRVTRVPLSGEEEVTYEYLSRVQKPRNGYDV